MNKRLLAVSWCMPPMVAPRSINVSRSLAALAAHGWTVEVIAGDLPPEERVHYSWDQALAEQYHGAFTVRHIPYTTDDGWEAQALAAARESIRTSPPHALITFAQPFPDHLIGLKLKHLFPELPWIAHFSDPWVDSPYINAQPAEFATERMVMEHADAVGFVTGRTRDLVMGKYPEAWKQKCFVIPHGFDEAIRAPVRRAGSKQLHLVHTGGIYGKRVPYALLESLSRLAKEQPGAYKVRFVGPVDADFVRQAKTLPVEVEFVPPTTPAIARDYALQADMLLLCDAPARESVFFPSKLVDYMPLGLPILALTPECGSTADVLHEIGGLAADPEDVRGQMDALRRALDLQARGELHTLAPSGEAVTRYTIEATNTIIMSVLDALCGKTLDKEPVYTENSLLDACICPVHAGRLERITNNGGDALCCPQGCIFPILKGIPRFVPADAPGDAPGDTHASAFDLPWDTLRKNQLDSYTKTTCNKDLLARIMGGPDAPVGLGGPDAPGGLDGLDGGLRGKTVLEAGCGAGRFSEVLLQAGARLYALDHSGAADEAQANCGHFPTLLVCQADILHMPFPEAHFDAVIGTGAVLHTPNPEAAIAALARMARPDGMVYLDYRTSGYPLSPVRRVLRSFLHNRSPEYGMRWCTRLRNLLWPVHAALYSRAGGGMRRAAYTLFARFSPLVDAQDACPQLPADVARERALLDTYDVLTGTHNHARTTEQISKALTDNGLEVVRCVYAGNGVEASARKPATERRA